MLGLSFLLCRGWDESFERITTKTIEGCESFYSSFVLRHNIYSIMLQWSNMDVHEWLWKQYYIVCVTGTGLIWGISKCIDINGKWLTDLSIGTLVILGLHPILICLCKLVYPIAELGVVNYFTGMVMMVVSLSIIRLCKKRFPKLIGK